MATIKQKGIRAIPTSIETRDRRSPSPPPGHLQPAKPDVSIIQYDPALQAITGSNPTHALVLSSVETSANAFFHRGCIYLPSRDELWTTSAPLQATDPSRPATVLMSKIKVSQDGNGLTTEWAKLRPPPTMCMPASGCVLGDGIIWCSQGSVQQGTGGVFHFPSGRPPKPITTSYYGRDFNSPHSVTVSDGGMWFTDPCCGNEADFRGSPQLPPCVYRYDQATREVRAVADGFTRPTGIAVDEGSSTLYVSDCGGVKVDGSLDLIEPRTIYAYDIIKRGDSAFLANKRVFALVRRGAPMHLMCENGNVWAACGDGVEIWSIGGSLLGVINVVGGVTSFCRGPGQTLFLCADQKLWRLDFSTGVAGRDVPPELL